MGQALYRKYRSKTLAEMVGQEHITEALANAITRGRISHAYLFTGPRGVGKTSAARILAHEINNVPYDDKTQHLDIIEIDAASNRRIDDIRDLRDRVHIAPTSAKYKVYIIDEVHMLTGESFNALLKTLEEPPEHVVFILATTEVHKLPATIVSRTQRYNFRLVELPKIVEHLRSIAKNEKITVDDAALELIAEHGDGSFRDSISLLDQLANVNNGTIDGPTVERSLGLASKKAINSLTTALIGRDHQAVIQQLHELEQQGSASVTLVPQLIRHLQQAALTKPELYTLIDRLMEVPRAYNPRLKLLTTLAQFALPAATVSTSPSPAPSSPPKHTPTPAVAVKPILDVEQTRTPKRRPIEQEVQQAEGQAISDLSLEQWADVLAQVKQASPPMHGVLRQAQPILDADKQVLTLKFKYPLHRKKIDDSKPKKALAEIMLRLFGGAPAIVTELDTTAEAPAVTIAPTPQATTPVIDEAANAVIAVMGGGKVVDA